MCAVGVLFGIARSQQTRKRIVEEVAILCALLDFDQVAGCAVAVIRRVIDAAGVFDGLLQLPECEC